MRVNWEKTRFEVGKHAYRLGRQATGGWAVEVYRLGKPGRSLAMHTGFLDRGTAKLMGHAEALRLNKQSSQRGAA